jgi:SPP1 gp7 family putative phage head morphogenesis protein
MANIDDLIAQKKATSNLLRTKYKPRKVRISAYPIALQKRYQRQINKSAFLIEKLVREMLIPELPRIWKQAENLRRDAYTYTDDITELINLMRATHGAEFTDAQIQAMASEQFNDIANMTRRQMTRQFSNSLGIDLFLREPWLQAELDGFVQSNVELIQSIPEQQFKKIESLVQRNVRQGRRIEDTIKDLKGNFKGSLKNQPRNRAELIARDQTSKLQGDLNHLRQTNLGIKEYIWRTSSDERVRPTHRANNGKTFAWDDPPATGHPGEDFQCRCIAEPIIEV